MIHQIRNRRAAFVRDWACAAINHWPCGAAIFLLCCLIASIAAAGIPPGDHVLFNTLLADLQESGEVRIDALPGEVRARAMTFRQRTQTFHSLLKPISAKPGLETYTEEKKREMERTIVALIDRKGIETLARDYASQAVLVYEWEGMSGGPLAEAASALAFLRANPATQLRPYLELFLAHRYRCLWETSTGAKEIDIHRRAARDYREHLATVMGDPDPLVRFVATDLDRRPFLYLKTPPPTVAVTAPPIRDETECSEVALADAIADPRTWSLRCFGRLGGDEATRPGTLAEFRADLDGDGMPELFIGSTVVRGNAGGIHFVFRPQGTSYHYLGSLLLHPAAFKVLAPAAAGERPSLALYWRLGAAEGLLQTVAYDGRAFVIQHSEKVAPQGADRARLVELFGAAIAAEPEPLDTAPALSIDQALALARRYVEEHKVDVSAQHIASVAIRYDDSPDHRGAYWHVQWMWTRPAMGGEYGLNVSMDGTIREARLGP